MKKSSVFLAATIMVGAVVCCLSISQSASGETVSGGHIKSVTAITEVFGDGQKIVAAALEYDQNIANAKLAGGAFSVEGRTITRVYSNTAATRTTAAGSDGKFVILELSPADENASIIPQRKQGGPGMGQQRPPMGGPGGPGGPGMGNPNRGPGGGNAGGPPSGFQAGPRIEAKIAVRQVGEVLTVTGEKVPASGDAIVNGKVINLIVDDFVQSEFKDASTGKTLRYNLYIPKNYDKAKSYPLVLFMHDASATGGETTRTLIQGLGAVVWASPSEQAKHPAFVLAPEFDSWASTEGAAGDTTADTVVHLVNSIAGQYSVDKNRMYTTGQSLGCMLSLAIMIRYPDLFAASMLVAGQRDAQATSVLSHNKMWIIVAEGDTRAFPGMNASAEVWEKEGAKISKATWNARSSETELTADAKKMIAEGNNIKYATFLKGTVFPPGKEGGIEHMATWPVAYRITGVRDWLFGQKK